MNQPPQGWAPLPAPPQMPPMPYYAPPPPVAPQKPSGGYKALGIVQMVFGVLGIFYALFGIASVTLLKIWSATAAVYDTATLVYMLTHSALAVVTGAMLAATGFGVYRAKRWSRLLGIAYACVSLAETVLGTAINLLVIQPAMYARMHSPIGSQMETFSIVTALFGVVIASILPIFTLVALGRSAAREQLDQ
jgi:hypothetical protein